MLIGYKGESKARETSTLSLLAELGLEPMYHVTGCPRVLQEVNIKVVAQYPLSPASVGLRPLPYLLWTQLLMSVLLIESTDLHSLALAMLTGLFT
jgi:hypothetical protein